MSEQDAATAVKAPLNDTESGYLNVLLSDDAARNLPARIFLNEGPAFVISPHMDLPGFLHDGEHTLVVINAAEYRELVSARSQNHSAARRAPGSLDHRARPWGGRLPTRALSR